MVPIEVVLSINPPAFCAFLSPNHNPKTILINIAVVKSRTVRGKHSAIIVQTSDSPEEDLIIVALPKSKERTLTALQKIRLQMGLSK
ncbi:hypothetical protein ES705_44242 [subsurface metagenome]